MAPEATVPGEYIHGAPRFARDKLRNDSFFVPAGKDKSRFVAVACVC
jgi:hypothetical protein